MKTHQLIRYLLLSMLAFVLCIASACQPEAEVRITIKVDGRSLTHATKAKTVRDALAEAGLALKPLDRVEPDLYTDIQTGMTITVTRVRQEQKTEVSSIPFQRKILTNEAIPNGETRLVQLGENGSEETIYNITYEDNKEVRRTELSRNRLKSPVDEILVVGAKDTLPSISFSGTIAYLSAGNAWVMNNRSENRRPVTTTGDLDSRVFSLSTDGSFLLFTRSGGQAADQPINTLWLQNAVILNEKPYRLPFTNVLWASWSPDGKTIAFSTAERTPGPPGWSARNDLWLAPAITQTVKATRIISPSNAGIYSWWGTNYYWSPDGGRLAYTRPDQIGVIELSTKSMLMLKEFAPYHTQSEWVWTPSLSWSPDGHFLIATIHGSPVAAEAPEDSPAFDLWLFSPDGKLSLPVKKNVGMWSNPVWGSSGILYGEALSPLQSVDSRYKLDFMDSDGSNGRTLHPFSDRTGMEFPQLAWSPDGKELAYIFEKNLYKVSLDGNAPQPLTSAGEVSQIRWSAPPMASTAVTNTLTSTAIISPSGLITATPAISMTKH